MKSCSSGKGKVIDFKIVTGDNMVAFEKAVQNKLRNGWELKGETFVYSFGRFVQVMVKREETKLGVRQDGEAEWEV